MLISSLRLEAKALKAYREDDSDNQIDDIKIMDSQNHIHGKKIFDEMNKDNPRRQNQMNQSEEYFMGGEAETMTATSKSKKRNHKKSLGGKILYNLEQAYVFLKDNLNKNQENKLPFSAWTIEQRKERVMFLWSKVRRYTQKLKQQARLQKMSENNIKKMLADDINDDLHDETNHTELDPSNSLKWYMIDKEGNFCKVWNFIITLFIIYELLVVPYILVFKTPYQDQAYDQELGIYYGPYYTNPNKPSQQNLIQIERVIDIFILIDIILNFLKKDRAHREIFDIALDYLKGTLIFDSVATFPNLLIFNENYQFYWLKIFRIVHIFRFTVPLELILSFVLQSKSKKRQNDLTSFCCLILNVIQIAHYMACIWLYLGYNSPCKINLKCPYNPNSDPSCQEPNQVDGCTASWVYKNSFELMPQTSQWIFAFYWIFEVITTVGYGDYTGATNSEYLFSIGLEFLGLTFFSFLMGSITSLFSTTDDFDSLIEEKLDFLDMWIKKIEKSNKPYHIQPTLYSDIRKYVEQAFMYDFNLVIEEFQFYQQLTPKMQTELIQGTKVFKEFEQSFNHFFDECERGFINEFIINMYCRIYTPGKTVIFFKTNVKEMYFVRQGIIQVCVPVKILEKDDQIPILLLPKFSYFGDYQILYNLRSKLVFKTMDQIPSQLKEKAKPIINENTLPDTYFMCVAKEVIEELCELFPQTAENIKKKSLDRRLRFMSQKKKMAQKKKNNEVNDQSLEDISKSQNENDEEAGLMEWESDEANEDSDDQKEDMKKYLKTLNKKIDTLVDALKEAESQILLQTSDQNIREQIIARDQMSKSQMPFEKQSIAQKFNKKINKNYLEDN